MALLREDWQKVANKVCAKNGLHEDLDLAYHLHVEQIPIYYDDHLEVGVEMRPIHLQRQERKEYMQQWPNCYRQHNQSSWPLAWAGSKVLQFGHWIPNILITVKQVTVRRWFALGRR